MFDNSADNQNPHLRHNSPVSVLKVLVFHRAISLSPKHYYLMLIAVMLIRCVLNAIWEAELKAVIK
jgi:hypothetical protein